MKIGLLNNLHEPFNRGGAEKVVAALLNDWRAKGDEVFLITTKPKEAPAPVSDTLKIYHLPSHYFDLARTTALYRFFWHVSDVFSFKKSRAIRKILQKEKPDLVMTHNLTGLGLLTPRVIRRLKIKHEHFLHDIQLLHPSGLMFYGREKKIDSLAARLYQSLTRAFFASPAKIISPSRWLLAEHTKRGFFKDSPIEIRPLNFLTISSRAEKKTTPVLNKNRYLFVGQMETHKGIFLLIKAFKKIADSDARLIMVGDGMELDAAKSAAQEDKRIEFLGRQEGDNLKKIMAEASCLVVPSLCYENSPTIIYEAQAMGLPVITSDLGGIPEIIGPEDALFAPDEETNLREKMEKAGI